MKEAMWKVDPDGEFRFSDATNPDQLVLFDHDSSEPLLRHLREMFASKGLIDTVRIKKHVEEDTPYLKKHMTGALKLGENEGCIHVEPTKVDGKKRRAKTFPDGVMISFT